MKLCFLIIPFTCLLFSACIDQSAEGKRTRISIEDSTSYTISKILPVSPEKVYNAFLDPQSLQQIWGMDSVSVDARVEGKTRGYIKTTEHIWDFTLTYKEVIPHQKLKWLGHFDKYPKIEIQTTLVLNSIKEGTEVRFSQENFNTKLQRDENKAANTESLNKLSSLLIKL